MNDSINFSLNSLGALRLPPPYKPGLGAEGTTKLAGGSVFSEAKLEKLREVPDSRLPRAVELFQAGTRSESCVREEADRRQRSSVVRGTGDCPESPMIAAVLPLYGGCN